MAARKPAPGKTNQSKAVAKTSGKALAPSSVLDAMESQAGSGFENMDTRDMSMPFLSIIQSNSPQLKKKNEKYLQGAEEGDIFNTVSGDLFSGQEGVRVIPCAYKMFLNEWVPRDDGGGLVAVHDRNSDILEECTRDKKGRHVTKGGNHIIETATYYVLVETDNGVWTRLVLPMTSTQLKKSRKWNTQMRSLMVKNERTGTVFNPPMYSHIYRLTTCDESNDQGEWKGWAINLEEMVGDMAVLQEAKAFRDLVNNNSVQADFSKMDGNDHIEVSNVEDDMEDDDL